MDQLYVVIYDESSFVRILDIDCQEIRIGRQADCGIYLSHGAVSRQHVQLTRSAVGWRIRDLGSRNGTYLNGIKLTAESDLLDGTEIRLGPYTLRFSSDIRDAFSRAPNVDGSTESATCPPNAMGATAAAPNLTPKQSIVYALLGHGLQEKEIATQMGISQHTVHEHVKAIHRALKVESRAEVILHWANHQGLRR